MGKDKSRVWVGGDEGDPVWRSPLPRCQVTVSVALCHATGNVWHAYRGQLPACCRLLRDGRRGVPTPSRPRRPYELLGTEVACHDDALLGRLSPRRCCSRPGPQAGMSDSRSNTGASFRRGRKKRSEIVKCTMHATRHYIARYKWQLCITTGQHSEPRTAILSLASQHRASVLCLYREASAQIHSGGWRR